MKEINLNQNNNRQCVKIKSFFSLLDSGALVEPEKDIFLNFGSPKIQEWMNALYEWKYLKK